MNAEDLPDVLTVDEVAAFLRISTASVYKGLHNKKIPSVRLGHKFVILKSELLRALAENSEGRHDA